MNKSILIAATLVLETLVSNDRGEINVRTMTEIIQCQTEFVTSMDITFAITQPVLIWLVRPRKWLVNHCANDFQGVVRRKCDQDVTLRQPHREPSAKNRETVESNLRWSGAMMMTKTSSTNLVS